MSGSITVNIILGLAIAGLLVLIVWMARKYYAEGEGVEGFQQATATGIIDIMTYMSSVQQSYTRESVPERIEGYECPPGEELSLGTCYPKCANNYSRVGSWCIPRSTTDIQVRPGEATPTCPANYEYDARGPRDLDCTKDGENGTSICPTRAPAFNPTCLKICPDTMRAASTKCLPKNPYTQGSEMYKTTYTCPPVLGVRYIRIRTTQRYMTNPEYRLCVLKIFAFDSTGTDVAAEKSVTNEGIANRVTSRGDIYGKLVRIDATRWYGNSADTTSYYSGTSTYRDFKPTAYSDYENVTANDRYPYLEIDLGKEYTLQSVTVVVPTLVTKTNGSTSTPAYSDQIRDFTMDLKSDRQESKSLQFVGGMLATFQSLQTTSLSKVVYSFRLSGKQVNTFRLYDAGTVNSTTRILSHAEANASYLRAYSDGLLQGTQVYYNSSNQGSLLLGTTQAKYLIITKARQYISIRKLLITLTDDTSYTITPSMVQVSGLYTGYPINNNLESFHSNLAGLTNNMYPKIPLATDYTGYLNTGPSFVCITFPSEINIKKIQIINWNTSDQGILNRLAEFDLHIYDKYQGNIYSTALSADIDQTYTVSATPVIEYGVCSIPCPYKYTMIAVRDPVTNDIYTTQCRAKYRGEERDPYDAVLKMMREQDYEKSRVPRTEVKSCRKNVGFDRYRLDMYNTDESVCSTPKEQNTSDMYYYCYKTADLTLEPYRPSVAVIPYAQNTSGTPFCPPGHIHINPAGIGVPLKWDPNTRITTNFLNVDILDPVAKCLKDADNKTVFVKAISYYRTDYYNGWPPEIYAITCPAGYMSIKDRVTNDERPSTYDYMTRVDTETFCYKPTLTDTQTCPVGYVRMNDKCMLKLDPDIATEAAALEVDYTDNQRCMIPCQHGFTLNTTNRKCEPSSTIVKYIRDTVTPTCETNKILDRGMGKCYSPCQRDTDIAIGNKCYPPGTSMYDTSGSEATYIPPGCPTGYEKLVDGACYKFCNKGFITASVRCVNASVNANSYTNANFTVPNVDYYKKTLVKTIKDYSIKTRGYAVTPSNFAMYYFYESMAKNAPVNMVDDWVSVGPDISKIPEANIRVVIYGNVSLSTVAPSGMTIQQELDMILYLAKHIYLGSPSDIDKYMLIRHNDLKPMLRNGDKRDFCKQEVVQSIVAGQFVIAANEGNKTFNATNCSTEITPNILACFSYNARNFVKNWIYSRKLRMIEFKVKNDATVAENNKPAEVARQHSSVSMMQPFVVPGLDIKIKTNLDSIGQAFYKATNGKYIMTYMYDVCLIGSCMLDVRFSMCEHGETAYIDGLITALTTKYNVLTSANVTQDMIDQAKADYENALADLQGQQTDNRLTPVDGMTGRFFYRLVGGTLVIDGFSLDARVVTTFMPELNCGLLMGIKDEPGNINYAPKTLYTENAPEQLVCTSPGAIKRAMSDYIDAVMDPNTIIPYPTGGPTAWDALGTLVVTQVTGATQVSPTQCAYTWKETAYDDDKNAPMTNYKDVVRNGIFSYVVNSADWYAKDIIFDISGFTLLANQTVSPCTWQPEAYKTVVGKRVFGMTNDQAFEDYFTFGINENRSLCPTTNPGLVFDPMIYAQVNSLAQFTGATPNAAGAINHYKTTGKAAGLKVANGFTIAALATPVNIDRPLPTDELSLDTANNLCPEATCQDMNVLYSLVDQYNNDPTLPGIILRVKRATTPNTSACHVEADIDWAAQIEDPTDPRVKARLSGMEYTGSLTGPIPKVVKGLSARPTDAPAGLETTLLELPMYIETSDCSYVLALDSTNNKVTRGSGVTIQSNTPALYKPMEYATEARDRILRDTGVAIDSVKGLADKVLGTARTAAMKYRGETYAAMGDIQTLEGCPTLSCSSPSILQKIAAYFKSQNLSSGLSMKSIQRTGTIDSLRCDVTYLKEASGTSGEVSAARFTLRPTGPCLFDVTSMTEIAVTPDWATMSNLALKDINTASSYKTSTVNFTPVDGFQNYGGAPARRPAVREMIRPPTQDVAALSVTAFGRDSARNQTAFALADMYTAPLFQEERVTPSRSMGAPRAAIVARELATEDDSAIGGTAAYKYLRFRTLKTRTAAADSVALARFAFFYGENELRMNGVAVSNPMGDWVGRVTDVTGSAGGKGFQDAYKKPIVFAFPTPVTVNGFSFTTSITEKAGADPVRWKLEGSHNGTFWQLLHDQANVDYPLPIRRGADLPVFKF